MATATSLTSTFNTVLTAHFRTWTTTEVIEQAYLGNALIAQLQRTNEVRLVGGQFHVPVSFIDDPQGDSYTGADVLSTAGVDPATIAKYQCAHYAEPVKVLLTDEIEAGAPDAVIQLAEFFVDQAQMRTTVLMARDLAASSQGSTKDLLPLNETAPASPSGTTYGSISQTSNTSWANQAQASYGSFASNLNKLETLSIDCQKNGLTDWDWGVCDSTTFARFKKLARTYYSIQSGATQRDVGRTADVGIGGKRQHIFFEDRMILHDRHLSDTWTRRGSSVSGPAATNGVIFLINNKAYKLAVVPGQEFRVSEWNSMAPSGQQGRIAYVHNSCQTICQERSALGRADGITA